MIEEGVGVALRIVLKREASSPYQLIAPFRSRKFA